MFLLSSMAFGSRRQVLFGRILPVLRDWVAAVLLWWYERAMLLLPSCISFNKASGCLLLCWDAVLFLPRLAGRGGEGKGRICVATNSSEACSGVLSIFLLWRGDGWMSLQIPGFLPWWKWSGDVPVSGTLNKRRPRPCVPPVGVVMVSILSAGRGGEGEGGGLAASSRMAQIILLLHRAQHMANKIVAMICGCEDCRSSRCVDSASTSSMEASARDSSRRFTPPGSEVICSPLLVAGGWLWSLAVGGEDPGLDLVIFLFSRVVSVKCQDCFRAFSLVRSCLQIVPTVSDK